MATRISIIGLPLSALLWLSAAPAALSQTEPPTTVHVDTRAALVDAVKGAQPGTHIALAPGVYRGGLTFSGVKGAADAWITLAAADPKNPPVIEGGASCIHLRDPSYLKLEGLILQGARDNGLNIDDGGTFNTPAHHIVLQDLTVRNVGPHGNHDGIKLSGVRDFVVEHCRVTKWGDRGSGIDMVGCHDGRIVSCTLGHGDTAGASGIQAKGGSTNVRIERCRFEHAGRRAVNLGGSTGRQFFRPTLTKTAGNVEARNITVTDCTFIGSEAPIAYVSSDACIVRYNTIYRPAKWVIRILQEVDAEDFVTCQRGRFEHNLIVWRSDDVRTFVNIGPNTKPDTFRFANNWWYCLDRPTRSTPRLPAPEQDPTHGADPQFINPAKLDLRVHPTSGAHNKAGARQPQIENPKPKIENPLTP